MIPIEMGWSDVITEWEKAERKKKAIDRIAWKAEELLGKAKGGHWK